MPSTAMTTPDLASALQEASVQIGLARGPSVIGVLVMLAGLGLALFMLVRIIRLVATGRTQAGAGRMGGGGSGGSGATKQQPSAAGSAVPATAPAEFGPNTQLRSLRLTMSAAAFLVPMAIAIVITSIAVEAASRYYVLSENPFGVHLWHRFGGGVSRGRWLDGDDPEVWMLLGSMSVLLAGHVGLLRAAYAGRTASSSDFFQGIKDHTITFFVGKLMLAAAVALISDMIGYRGVSWEAILFVVPSLLMAPLIGTAALYPRQPIKAIKAALSHSTGDIHGIGKLVTIQILLLMTAWMAFGASHNGPWWFKTDGLMQLPLFASGTNTLSFNTLPMIQMFHGGFGELLAVGFTVICSTVFLGCHFLKVMDSVPQPEDTDQTVPAGQTA